MICNSRAHTTDRCEYNLLNRQAAPVRHIEPGTIRTRKKIDSGETTATNASATIDTLIDDVTTMTATKNAETTTEGTSMSERTLRNMTDAETIGAKGTETSNGIKREDFSAWKNAEKQQEMATQHWHRITGKPTTTAG